MSRERLRSLWGAVLVVTLAGAAAGQGTATAIASYAPGAWLAPNDSFALVVRRSSASDRLVVFVGTADVTALFTERGDSLLFLPRGIPLPAGEHEVIVHSVDERQAWTEVGRIPLRVRNRAGFERAVIDPALVVSSHGALAAGPTLAPDESSRTPVQDMSATLGIQTTHTRSAWSIQTHANLLGASNRDEALRFAELQQRAPKLDLTDYLVTVERASTTLSLGHFGFGQHRHLMNGFSSRGANGSVRFGSRSMLTLAALGGSTIVGYANPTGLAQPDHRIVAGTLGVDLVPEALGALRLEGTVVDGSVLPIAGYDRGAIVDAEMSEGTGLRLHGSAPGERVRFDAGYSRSKSDYLPDSALSGGFVLSGVTRAARSAWYLDLSADVVRHAIGTSQMPLNVALAFRAEHVDPLYRSVAISVQPDVASHAFEVQGTIGAFTVNAVTSRLRDNLGHIESILTTRTDASSVAIGLPLVVLARSLRWLPALSVALQHNRQYGAGVPPNSGFSPTHVPDQVNAIATVGLQWTGSNWHFEYRANTSDQDNRQVGRERSDLLNTTHAVTLGLTPSTRLSLTVDVGFDGARNAEFDQRMNTRRWATSAQGQPFASTTLNATYALTTMGDQPETQRTTSEDLRLEWQQRLPFLKWSAAGSSPQFFVRHARQHMSVRGSLDAASSLPTWTLTSGFTIPIH